MCTTVLPYRPLARWPPGPLLVLCSPCPLPPATLTCRYLPPPCSQSHRQARRAPRRLEALGAAGLEGRGQEAARGRRPGAGGRSWSPTDLQPSTSWRGFGTARQRRRQQHKQHHYQQQQQPLKRGYHWPTPAGPHLAGPRCTPAAPSKRPGRKDVEGLRESGNASAGARPLGCVLGGRSSAARKQQLAASKAVSLRSPTERGRCPPLTPPLQLLPRCAVGTGRRGQQYYRDLACCDVLSIVEQARSLDNEATNEFAGWARDVVCCRQGTQRGAMRMMT